MPDIRLPDAYIVNEDYGTALEFLSMYYNAKEQRLVVIYEMHDGVDWLGPQLIVIIDKNRTTMTKLDGSTKAFPNIKFSMPAVQALLDKTLMNNFIKNQGGDLRLELP